MIPARPKARPGDLVARIGQHGEGQLLRLLRGQGIRLAPPGRWRPGRCRARPARPGWPRGVSRQVPPRAASARSGMALSTSARALMPLASGGRSALALGFADAEYQLGYADVGVGAGGSSHLASSRVRRDRHASDAAPGPADRCAGQVERVASRKQSHHRPFISARCHW